MAKWRGNKRLTVHHGIIPCNVREHLWHVLHVARLDLLRSQDAFFYELVVIPFVDAAVKKNVLHVGGTKISLVLIGLILGLSSDDSRLCCWALWPDFKIKRFLGV